jgi:hypothetical protein
MSTLFLEGFEHVAPTTPSIGQVLPSEFETFFEIDVPAVTTDWFINSAGTQDDSSGPMVVNEGRVGGQSIRIQRPNASTNNAAYNGSVVLPFRKTISDKAEVIAGFGVKFSRLPYSEAVPLIRFGYDDGIDNNEQCCIWADRQGRLFMASEDLLYDDTVMTVTAVADTQTATAKMNFNNWTYIEVKLDLSGTTPTLTIDCNGENVLFLENVSVQKHSTDDLINTVEFINVHNGYFNEEAFTQWLDDFYIFDGLGDANNDIAGPQYIIRVPVGDPFHAEWAAQGAGSTKEAVSGQYDKDDLTAFALTSLNAMNNYIAPGSADPSIGWINAVGITVFVSVDAGSDDLTVAIGEGALEDERVHSISNTNPKGLTSYFDLDPLARDWNMGRLALADARVGS